MTETTGTSSPASAGEGGLDAITDDDLETLHRIQRAFEARFPAWYVAEKLGAWDRGVRSIGGQGLSTKEKAAEYFEDKAHKFSFHSIDEDGDAKFVIYWRGDIDDSELIPFSAIIGTTEEAVERHKASLQARAEAARERVRRDAEEAKRKAEAKRAVEALAEQERRERIFREEAKKRGIVVPS